MDFEISKEQQAMAREVLSFARKHLNGESKERDASCQFGKDEWKKCGEMGLLGLPVPAQYGGEGADMVSTVLVMESLGHGCSDNGLVHAINSHLWGCLIPLVCFGTEEQKQRYLPVLCTGERIGAHAVTEPEAGSDALSLTSTAVKTGEHYLLNGTKSIVSNGPIANIFVVFAVTDSSKKFMGGISAFILERGDSGLAVGEPLRKMGLNTSPISELFLSDCRIPADRLLGREGSGIAIFNETMAWERSCLFSCHIGCMRRILDECVEYSKKRRQFGQFIGKYQAVSHQLADIKVNLELGKLMLLKIACMKRAGQNVLLESSIAKLFIGESLKKAALAAVQIHGAYGYMSEMGIEKEVRDAVAATIYSGTSEIQRNIIARCLGL
jgi:alkylation response protein AidB-like acyl-CoA dehydrogenase